jgi:hypothetical protein
LQNWSSAGGLVSNYHYECGDTDHDLFVTPTGADTYRVRSGDDEITISVRAEDDGMAVLDIGGTKHSAFAQSPAKGQLNLNIDGYTFRLRNLIGLSAREKLLLPVPDWWCWKP